MNIPVLGLVENMAYFKCPDCGNKHYIFGKGNLDEIAAENNIKAVAEIPMDPNLAKLCDEGLIEDYDAGKYLGSIIDALK